MTRLITVGGEVSVTIPATSQFFPDFPLGAGSGPAVAVTRATTHQRTGAACLACGSGAGNGLSYWDPNYSPVAGATFYLRAYMNFDALPGSTVQIMSFGSAVAGLHARLTAAGKVQLFNGATSTQIGSDSAATVSAGTDTYYRVEMKIVLNGSTQISDIELQLDGTSVASTSGLAIASLACRIGWTLTAPGANKTVYLDDIAMNNGSGANNNTWPGAGAVVLLLPTATSAAGTGWVLGNNTAEGGNGWNSVNNTPPVGIADLGGAGADTGQIRNATSAANSNFDATMTTYTAAGIGAADTINAVTPWTITAAPVVTSAKQGTVGVVSNPAITNIAFPLPGTAGAFWSGATGGTFITGWKGAPGTITEAPSVTLGTAPVMRVTQVTSSTRIAMVCFMGIYVDYTPAATGFIAAPIEARYQQAVYRAASF